MKLHMPFNETKIIVPKAWHPKFMAQATFEMELKMAS
jgi:hypothetical protein